MLMRVVDHLRRARVDVNLLESPEGVNGLIELSADGLDRVFAIQEKRRAPYPSEISDLAPRLIDLTEHGAPLLIAPYVSEGTGELLNDHGWSWADEVGNLGIRSRGLRLFRRVSNPPPRPARRLPQGSGALAIVRFLIRESIEGTRLGPTELSNIARVSQPRASQVLSRLHELGLVEKLGDGYCADREALLDAFLNEYRGPGGSELLFYSLDVPVEAALRVLNALDLDGVKVAVSADVGPDLIAPWRSPSDVIIYVDGAVDLASIDMTAASSRGDANVILCFPDDTSVFRYPPQVGTLFESSIPLADETQMLWDLHELGGDDRIEAADRLKRSLLGTCRENP